ncbi:biotin transporter BioY [Acidobacteria bacterium AB60]|nr:biotin transporter BioY [Acidobacteria bacterium AB60]
MNRETHIEETPAALSLLSAGLRHLFVVLAGSAFVAVCAHIALPLSFTPVPLTLQPFAVLLLGLLLSPRLGAATLTAYLVEGASGLPVFTPATVNLTGVYHLLGPTGGYLLAYPFAVYVIAALWRTSKHNLWWAILSTAAGNLLILTVGAGWFSILSHASLNTVLADAVIPFLPGDALKVAVAAALGYEWYRNRPARPRA